MTRHTDAVKNSAVFDLKRMQRALKGKAVRIPHGLSRDELRQFLVRQHYPSE